MLYLKESNQELKELNNYEQLEQYRDEKDESLTIRKVGMKNNQPIYILLDEGKAKYTQKKKAKNQIKTKKSKIIKLNQNIQLHDLEIKANTVIKLLNKGHKVICTLIYRGRVSDFNDKKLKILRDLIVERNSKVTHTKIKKEGTSFSFEVTL